MVNEEVGEGDVINGCRYQSIGNTYMVLLYRVSSKTVPTWLFALLSASTNANCKSWDVFKKFWRFAT